jgi:hypothetical protein
MSNGNDGWEGRGHHRLEAWKKSRELVLSIYTLTQNFPKEEMFGLTSQIRRAAVSVPSNIAEGAARAGQKKFAQFLNVARGSLRAPNKLNSPLPCLRGRG